MNFSRLCVRLLAFKPPYFHPINKNIQPLTTCYHHKLLQTRYISKIETKDVQKEENLVRRIIKKIPFLNAERTQIMASGYFLYEIVADKINYMDFFQELDLPDTFYSWFVVTELHIWMISARAMAEGENGRLLRNYLVEALWNDVGQRTKKLGGESNPAAAREQVTELSEQLQAALIAYDEGLLGDDTVLAGALWRRFYQQGEVEFTYLDTLVQYVRKQMRLLDHLSKESLMETRNWKWISLKHQ